ncbi:translation initiation factor IF-2 [bacterium]|nr:translation initiation factor IF-2 [bacterium]
MAKESTAKKMRVYQVAKECNVANETLIEFLKSQKFTVRNHMAPITESMYEAACKQFRKEEPAQDKSSDFRKKLQEKHNQERARQEAVRHEIDEVLEMSKREVFTPAKSVWKKEDVEKELAEKRKEQLQARKAEEARKAAEEIAVEKAAAKAKAKAGSEEIEQEPSDTAAKKEKKKAEPLKEKETAEEKEKKADKQKRHLKRRPKTEKEESDEDAAETKGKKRKKPVTEVPEEDTQEGKKKKKRRRRRKKREVVIDEKEIEASIKKTLARMDDTTSRKKRRKKDIADAGADADAGDVNAIKTTEFATVSELANLLDTEPSEVIKICLDLGLMVSINQRLDRDTIMMVAGEFDYSVEFQTVYSDDEGEEELSAAEDPGALKSRAPVVTIMGHVDHGKTSLLDYVRKTNVISGESGGITQHIGAYEVDVNGKSITFLDTPGHEAFTAMRARGAQVTDIVVLVVAANDGVMPQTVEAINHAKAAGVPIIVAINKIDLPSANLDMVKKHLSEHDVLVEDWGGQVQCVPVSAKSGEGVDRLMELILLEAEVLELKANPDGIGRGVIVEARIEQGKGTVGTVLVQRGTLKIGDCFVAGQYYGKIRALLNEWGKTVPSAGPSTPVQILGFTGTPQAGDVLTVHDSEQEAREISRKRQQLEREQSFRQQRRLTLDQIGKRIAEGEVKELSVIIKADVDGSKEAIADALMELSTDDVAVRIRHKAVGEITESDVLLAEASEAVIIGFHVHPNAKARETANRDKVDIRLYKVIYDIVNDVTLALTGMLDPDIEEEIIGSLEVRQVFKASKIGQIAGCYVKSGKITRKSNVRLYRDDEMLYEGTLSSLKRFNDDVKEVSAGYECGLTLVKHDDVAEGDTIEVYVLVEKARTLQ